MTQGRGKLGRRVPLTRHAALSSKRSLQVHTVMLFSEREYLFSAPFTRLWSCPGRAVPLAWQGWQRNFKKSR